VAFLSHDVTTEERPGGAGACFQSSSGHSNPAGEKDFRNGWRFLQSSKM
jgi:hypothetical protein